MRRVSIGKLLCELCGEPEPGLFPVDSTQGGRGGQRPTPICDCAIGAVWRARFGACPFVGECANVDENLVKKQRIDSQRAGYVTPARYASIG
jgi:hypothetical protein